MHCLERFPGTSTMLHHIPWIAIPMSILCNDVAEFVFACILKNTVVEFCCYTHRWRCRQCSCQARSGAVVFEDSSQEKQHSCLNFEFPVKCHSKPELMCKILWNSWIWIPHPLQWNGFPEFFVCSKHTTIIAVGPFGWSVFQFFSQPAKQPPNQLLVWPLSQVRSSTCDITCDKQ